MVDPRRRSGGLDICSITSKDYYVVCENMGLDAPGRGNAHFVPGSGHCNEKGR